MYLIGCMPCRNEDWICGLSVRVALKYCDELIVLNHASTDRTAEILNGIAAETGRLTILDEPDPVWYEMAHRQRLLDAARAHGATHIALTDADEILTANTLPVIRGLIESLQPAEYLLVPFRAMWRSPFQVRCDPGNVFSRAYMALAFCDSPSLYWSAVDGYDFHHREPYGSQSGPVGAHDGGVMHMQFADWRRIVAKHAAYKQAEVLRWPNRRPAVFVDRQYDATLNEDGLETAVAPESWWEGYPMEHLHIGGDPWQAGEVKRLLVEHGAARFAGLNLYGVGA